jgi:hypothetical protein
VYGDLGWRQPKDKPAMARVDVVIAERVSEERTVRLEVAAVDDHMGPIDHVFTITAWREANRAARDRRCRRVDETPAMPGQLYVRNTPV